MAKNFMENSDGSIPQKSFYDGDLYQGISLQIKDARSALNDKLKVCYENSKSCYLRIFQNQYKCLKEFRKCAMVGF